LIPAALAAAIEEIRSFLACLHSLQRLADFADLYRGKISVRHLSSKIFSAVDTRILLSSNSECSSEFDWLNTFNRFVSFSDTAIPSLFVFSLSK
jgi:hypothetical protein